MSSASAVSSVLRLGIAASAWFVLGCGEAPVSPTMSAPAAPVLAKATSDIVVSSATPDSATQDTTLDVTVSGSGFTSDAIATWALSGVSDSTQVRTNSTRYVNSRTLVANITISSTATLGKWDVMVQSKTKGGIGSELFTVKVRGQPRIQTKANLVWEDTVNVAAPGQPAVWQKALLVGDYRNLYGSPISNGTSGEYQHGFCGSYAYMQTQPNGSYPEAALNFDTDFAYDPATMDGPCGGARYYQVFFSGRGSAPVRVTPQHYALKLSTLDVGQSLLEEVHFGVQLSNCAPLRYDDAYPPSNNARVTRLPDTLTVDGPRRRWRVESQGSHRAMCTVNTNRGVKPVASYYLPFAYTIIEVMAPFPSYP